MMGVPEILSPGMRQNRLVIRHMKTKMHNKITLPTADWKVCFQGVMYRDDLFAELKCLWQMTGQTGIDMDVL